MNVRKLSDEIVINIYTSNERLKDTAAKYGIKISTVSNIRRGVMRGKVTKGLERGIVKTGAVEKVSDEDVKYIVKSINDKTESYVSLARRYKVSSSYIYFISRGLKRNENEDE